MGSTFVVIFLLVTGEVAELPVTKEQCLESLEMAARSGSIIVHLSVSGRRESVPAWGVACVERLEGEAPKSAQR